MPEPRRRPGAVGLLVAAGLAHLVVLLAPVLVLGRLRTVVADPRVVCFLTLVTVWMTVEALAARASCRPIPIQRHAHRLELAIGATILAVFWTGIVEAATSPGASVGVSILLGAPLIGLGIVLRRAAIEALGPSFMDEVTVLSGQPLVTHGVYRALRHPSEAGTLCIVSGAAVLMESAVGVAVAVALLAPAVVLRTRLEDRVLRRHYSDVFGAYAESVPALIPRPGSVLGLRRRWKDT